MTMLIILSSAAIIAMFLFGFAIGHKLGVIDGESKALERIIEHFMRIKK